MRSWIAALLVSLAMAAPCAAQTAPKAAAPVAAKAGSPVTVEYYYRIRWGSMGEFLELYRRNHEPILREMQKLGLIVSIRTEMPYTHLAGGVRWDLRVTIVYRDGETAVGDGTGYEAAAAAAADRLYSDVAKHKAEEAKRFSLIEEHWDVIVMPAGE